MIAFLLRASLARRWLVLGCAAALVVVGLYRAAMMPVDVFPDLTAPRVTIVTEATGMAAEEIEQLVTFPIETTVNGATGVRRVRSASAPGISVIWVEFDWDTTGTIARQRVTERLQSLDGTLPEQADAPLLAPASSVMGEIAFVAMTSDSVDPIDLRRTAEVAVRRRLLAVEGISQVVAIGGLLKQFHVNVDPFRCEQYGLTLAEIVAALQRGSTNAPGGYLVEGGRESVIRVLGRASTTDELGRIVVEMADGVPIRVRDVADVSIGAAVARGAASYQAKSAVILTVVKQPDADTVSTTQRVDAALGELEEELAAQKIQIHRDVFRQLDFIETSIASLLEVLRDGAILVAVVLFVFLWSFRPTLISVVAIPLSLVVAIVVLDAAGLRIDTMTLGGLAIAIGELVDDAIVDVENVARRLRERRTLPDELRPTVRQTVLSASLEIRSSIVSATFVLMLVFAPLLALEGLEGRLLQPLAIAYLVAIFASLIVAVTVTPVLCMLLLPKGATRREPPVIRGLVRLYEPTLRMTMQRPWAVLMGSALMFAIGIFGISRAGRTFLPEFNEGSLTIQMVLEPGTSLEQSDALATMAERALMADPAVLSVGRRTGRAERDEHVLGVETSEFEVRLGEGDPRRKSQVFADIRERLQGVPGGQFTLGQPISHRIEHMMSGQRAAVAIKVFGPDLREDRRVANAVRDAIADIDGLADLTVEQVVDIPQVVVTVDEQAAAALGFSTGEAARAIGTALWGTRAAAVLEPGVATDVVVKYSGEDLDDLEKLSRTRIPTPNGALVPISMLAEIRRDAGPNYILRENVERRVLVTANLHEGAAEDVLGRVRRAIEDRLELPTNVRIEYAGQFERERDTLNRLIVLGALAVLGIALIVGTTLGSLSRTLIVLVNLPLALAGGVVGVYLAGGTLSIATTIGFITLFGIAARNGILLVTRAADLEIEGVAWLEAVRQAARERLAPILMTAVTGAFGLLPLALALGRPGAEIQAPMALVILTGLVTSTLLNAIVVPALLTRWGSKRLNRRREV